MNGSKLAGRRKHGKKVIFVTGSTHAIGLEIAKLLAGKGHQVLLHGRNRTKLENARTAVSGLKSGALVERYVADLSRMADADIVVVYAASLR